MSGHGGELKADDEYGITWYTNKSSLLAKNRNYSLEVVGRLVVSGSAASHWSKSDKYRDQDRYTFRIDQNIFLTLVTEDCKVHEGFEHLVTFFPSGQSDIDGYLKEFGVRHENT